MNTTSYGTGELILEGLNQGCRKFIIGIGASCHDRWWNWYGSYPKGHIKIFNYALGSIDFRITGKWYDNGEVKLQENSRNDRINTYRVL